MEVTIFTRTPNQWRQALEHHMLRFLALASMLLFSGCHRPAITGEDELQVQEALVRYQMTHNAAAGKYEFFCLVLARGANSVPPPDRLIRRLNDGVNQVFDENACDPNEGKGVLHKVSGNPALILKIGEVQWESDTSATVTGGYYAASESASGNVYHLKKVEGVWRVVKDEMKWIS